MINALAFVFFFISLNVLAHDHIPHPSQKSSVHTLLRLISRYSQNQSFLIEHQRGQMYGTQLFQKTRAGFYHRFDKEKKLGLFFLQKKGQRHLDDWVVDQNGNWYWINSENRDEQEFHLDYTLRHRPDIFSPVVYSFIPKVTYNFFNTHAMLVLTGEFNYFFLIKGRPFLSSHTRFATYTPLNFKGDNLYKYGLYQKFLYHISKQYILGFGLNYFVERWTPSLEFREIHPNENYFVTDRNSLAILEFTIKV